MLTLVLTLTSLAVLVRIIANPLANVFQKQLTQQQAEPTFVTAATYGFLSLVCLVFWREIELSQLPIAFWGNDLLVSVLAVLGNVLLVKALHKGDLSVLGPINAYKSVVSLLFGLFLLQEIPSVPGLLGVGLTVIGSYVVLGTGSGPKASLAGLWQQPEIRWRLAALLCSAVEAVFIKRAMLHSSPLTTFVFWCLLGFALSLLWLAGAGPARWKAQGLVLLRQRKTYLALFVAVGLMQFSTNLAFGGTQVGYALALFQISALLSVLFGYQFFNEKQIVRKLIGAAIMVTGAVFIVLFQ